MIRSTNLPMLRTMGHQWHTGPRSEGRSSSKKKSGAQRKWTVERIGVHGQLILLTPAKVCWLAVMDLWRVAVWHWVDWVQRESEEEFWKVTLWLCVL